MTQLVDDIIWAWHMFRVRRIRRSVPFSRRCVYDRQLRPSLLPLTQGRSSVIDYPDAIYHITRKDMIRAAAHVENLVP